MNWFLLIIVTINLLSVFFLLLTLKRVRNYLRKMVLPESEYTLLFKLFGMKFAIYAYIVVIVSHSVITLYIAVLNA